MADCSIQKKHYEVIEHLIEVIDKKMDKNNLFFEDSKKMISKLQKKCYSIEKANFTKEEENQVASIQ